MYIKGGINVGKFYHNYNNINTQIRNINSCICEMIVTDIYLWVAYIC